MNPRKTFQTVKRLLLCWVLNKMQIMDGNSSRGNPYIPDSIKEGWGQCVICTLPLSLCYTSFPETACCLAWALVQPNIMALVSVKPGGKKKGGRTFTLQICSACPNVIDKIAWRSKGYFIISYMRPVFYTHNLVFKIKWKSQSKLEPPFKSLGSM